MSHAVVVSWKVDLDDLDEPDDDSEAVGGERRSSLSATVSDEGTAVAPGEKDEKEKRQHNPSARPRPPRAA